MCQANGLLSSFRVGPQVLFPAPIWSLCPAPCWVPSTGSPRLVFCQPSSLGVWGGGCSTILGAGLLFQDLPSYGPWKGLERAMWGPGPCVETGHLTLRVISPPFLSLFCHGKKSLHVWPGCLCHLSTRRSFFLRNREQSQCQAISSCGIWLCLTSL